VIRVITDLYQMAEAMGATVHYPEDETAYLEAPAITTVAEIGRLTPLNPLTDGNLPAHLEAIRGTSSPPDAVSPRRPPSPTSRPRWTLSPRSAGQSIQTSLKQINRDEQDIQDNPTPESTAA
jgi:hypothetical protein